MYSGHSVLISLYGSVEICGLIRMCIGSYYFIFGSKKRCGYFGGFCGGN